MRLHRTRRPRTVLPPTFGLLLLSAWWAVASLRTDLHLSSGAAGMPPVAHQAVLFSVFTAVAASIAVARRAAFPGRRHAWACVWIGLGLFVVPAALVAYAKDRISTLDRVAVFSLTPVFAVVLQPYLQGTAPRQGKAALAGALAAVAGILCILPLDIPGSLGSGAALCALLAAAVCVAATNCFAVRLVHELMGRSTLPMAALAGAAGAVYFAALSAFTQRAGWRWSALAGQSLALIPFDLAALFLLFWLMRRLSASQMTARFLLAPLFAIVAGMALEPASPPARAWLGVALLAGGAGWLVFAPAGNIEEEEMRPPRIFSADTSRLPPP